MSISSSDGSGSQSPGSPISLVHEAVQQRHGRYAARHYPIREEYRECADSNRWGCDLSTPSAVAHGEGATKRAAKNSAFKSLHHLISDSPSLLDVSPPCSCIQKPNFARYASGVGIYHELYREGSYNPDADDRLPPSSVSGEPFAPHSEAYSPPSNLSKGYMFQSLSEQISLANKVSKSINRAVYVYVLNSTPENLVYRYIRVQGDLIRCQEDNSVSPGRLYVLSRTSQSECWSVDQRIAIMMTYLVFPGTYVSSDGCKITLGVDNPDADEVGDSIVPVYDPSLDGPIVPNSGPPETPIEPVAQVGVQDNPGTLTVPHLPNPQPTAVTPAMAIQDPSLVSALEPLLPHDLLNPIGPPNMLGVGGVTFDIKDLIYSQYLDCDVQYQYTDDTPQGQIIFQIPYDPTSQYVNPYIRQWLSMHPRYTGALNFRFTVVGNTTFSGLIGFAWYPRTINATVVKISEMMKYSYTTMGINEPSNRIFTLFDARQTAFWRDTSDDPSMNPRPVLVAFIYMTAVSPLKEGITIRIRVASKLSDGSDGPAFVAAEPTIPSSTPGVGVPAPTGINLNYNDILTGMPFIPVFARPIILTNPLYLAVDGRVYKPYMNVTETGDYILDTALSWVAQPSSTQQGFITGAWSLYESQGLYNQGIYIMDCSKAQSLLAASDTDPSFIPVLASDFYNQYSQYEEGGGKFKDTYGVLNAVSAFTKVYQIVQYLSPASFGTGNAWYIVDSKTKTSITFTGMNFYCLYTDAGPVFFASLQWKPFIQNTSPIVGYASKSPFHSSLFDITQISSITPNTLWTPETMPAGWRNVSITADLPFVVSQGAPGVNATFQSYNHPSIQSIFHQLAINALPTQVLQLTLADLDSGNDLCYVRYYQDRLAAVINFGPDADNSVPDYMTMVRPTTRAYISHVDIVERSNTFPISSINNFASNSVKGTLTFNFNRRLRESRPYNPQPDFPIKANSDKATQTPSQNFPERSRKVGLAGPLQESEINKFRDQYNKSIPPNRKP
uniref:Calicivirus coat protein domain-containing protein n=1 Tax=Riboviria sp. TaxID=2585031 RepID=A0A6M9Z788_9VIRU|nr:MAG: hypothetical protein 2 [Riboviria sp.]